MPIRKRETKYSLLSYIYSVMVDSTANPLVERRKLPLEVPWMTYICYTNCVNSASVLCNIGTAISFMLITSYARKRAIGLWPVVLTGVSVYACVRAARAAAAKLPYCVATHGDVSVNYQWTDWPTDNQSTRKKFDFPVVFSSDVGGDALIGMWDLLGSNSRQELLSYSPAVPALVRV